MNLRTRLFLIFGGIVIVTVALMSYAVAVGTRKMFQALDGRRIEAVKDEIDGELKREGETLAVRTGAIAQSQPIRNMVLALSSTNADPAPFLNLAPSLAAEQQLDFLEILAQDSTIISSAHWPARFGLRESWLNATEDWNKQPAFLRYVETPQGNVLGLLSVRKIGAEERSFYIVAGLRIDSSFVRNLVVPQGMTLLLWQQPPDSDSGEVVDSNGRIKAPSGLKTLLESALAEKGSLWGHLRFATNPGEDSLALAIPLRGRDSTQPVAILVVATSRRELADLQSQIRNTGLVIALGGIALSLIASRWWATRISSPIEELSSAARDVTAGNWDRKAYVESSDQKDEVVQLVSAFNTMTDELLRQRDRAVQAERVAAWRELARRLAHELKNPLFPLQITIENLTKARRQNSPEFEEIFAESTATLLAELSNLKKIVGRFSDFSRMPAPKLREVDVNRLLEDVLKLFAPQLCSAAKPIELETKFTSANSLISGDPDLLRRAFENLVLNAIDAMPGGGKLRISTSSSQEVMTVEVSDTGIGLTEEEASRLFTPYYTTKQHGTGLGLAIVQSVISDHGGRISVAGRPGEGATFRMEFQRKSAAVMPGAERAYKYDN